MQRDPYLLGPCRCRGCGQQVVWMRYRRGRGWLHESGNFSCLTRPSKDTSQRAYWRVMKRLSRAA